VTDPSQPSPTGAATRGGSPLRGLAYLLHRWVLRSPFLVADIPGSNLRFKVRTRDVNGRHLYKYGRYEPELTAWLRAHLELRDGDVVVDIGANMGWYSLLAERQARGIVDVLAFEPDPDNYALLTENLALNGARRVTPLQLAVSSAPGTVTLHRYRDTNLGRHSVLPINDGESVEVPAVTLDGFWAERGLGERVPRFIKIDVEGYELVALRGARAVLARCPLLLAEYSPNYMRAGGQSPAEFVDYLTGLGFRPHALRGGRLAPVDAATLPAADRHTDLFWRRDGAPA
jgi:FkbM family methyltransferase